MVRGMLEVLLGYICIIFLHIYHVFLRKVHLKLCLVKYLIKIVIYLLHHYYKGLHFQTISKLLSQFSTHVLQTLRHKAQ